MPRPPKARPAILDAAERIVKEHGAANLTFDELARVSGVTRGGITYHFPTKEMLLQALVLRDVEHWSRRLTNHRQQLGDCPGAEVIAHLRSAAEDDPERRRLIGGLLSAVAHDPSLLQPVREFAREAMPPASDLCQAELKLWILRMASDGLFWADMMKCTELPAGLRERLVAEIERLAAVWGLEAAQAATAPEACTVKGALDLKQA
ncbi:MAG: TetR family transcriptional regulator [Xanthomonadales bacterium]|nr:TetR family transcriptional regulator [Xanthomonadales bacterium]MCB1642500.1 TetR family transcriptional regulator [Xanthomonadales bacterium]